MTQPAILKVFCISPRLRRGEIRFCFYKYLIFYNNIIHEFCYIVKSKSAFIRKPEIRVHFTSKKVHFAPYR